MSCSLAVSEEIIKSTADIMTDSGLQKAGYEYLVIDGRCLSQACTAYAVNVQSPSSLIPNFVIKVQTGGPCWTGGAMERSLQTQISSLLVSSMSQTIFMTKVVSMS